MDIILGVGDNEIDYVTMASAGNAIDFGDISSGGDTTSGGSSSTRGIFVGGSPDTNVIDYVEISTLGDALDFGDLSKEEDIQVVLPHQFALVSQEVVMHQQIHIIALLII